jgi:hypothetical protein
VAFGLSQPSECLCWSAITKEDKRCQTHQLPFVLPVVRRLLNVAPLRFDDFEMTVGVLPYESREQLADLRGKHDATHVFRRDSATEILAVPYVPQSPQIGSTFRTVPRTENLELCAALVRNGLVNYLHGLPRKVFRHQPVVFLADEAKDNFLQQCLPKGTVCPNWLSVVPLYEVEVRVYHFEKMEPFVGVCLNVRTRNFLNRPCNELLAEGFPLVGHPCSPAPHRPGMAQDEETNTTITREGR